MAQAKYTPFGDRLNPSVAIVQAANALDIAAKFAVESKDTDTLVRVAREWVEISGRLVYDDEEEDDIPQEKEEGRPFGFSVTSDIGEEDAEDDSSEG
ncbi:hypothetical protein FDI36_gp185 [Streptomyces phage NootNoot]|uniref:Uncharacterized protein n=2 Tax=Samistivirus TaxID=2560220 RepID=A0A514U1Y0_9CAUD|nr:hypothetical protein FDI36_gp185 [Streptomyces phage NootNoot]YP_010103964.1 hypothetical protein KNU71_gp192 [Streptomyces phage Braelyn]UGL63071.1 hypothetical protein SEA_BARTHOLOMUNE_71 [Streptomyces phage Bartholomune]UOW93504.1 hypothetical protein SEA_SQUILLIUM_72 [Streptomyces phage Squillium]WNM73336.1 hypothetical protein SEA_LIANDRY_72 [Streptomyces phage Liandry]WNM74734.1 hypothetical protein SEA_PINKIEPIE_71 [Streptomyces phage PinkiePie]ASR77337.1 hypothetical protein SEA_NO